MDYPHNIKKLKKQHLLQSVWSWRRQIIANKHLQIIGSKLIIWKHWVNAFRSDQLHNPVRVQRKLTNEHLFVTETSKIRNHLAEDEPDETEQLEVSV